MNLRIPICKSTTFVLFFIFLALAGTAQNYPAVFDLTTLKGNNGFAIPGTISGERVGAEVDFIGDINHDGLDDICLGTEYAQPGGLLRGGTAYIIFGSAASFPATFDLNTLDGTNGFKVVGIVEDERRGKSASGLGDVNGDGIDDLILGTQKNQTMVIYGTSGTFPAVMDVTDMDGTNGFIIDQGGINEVNSAGDVNGDGHNDFMLGQAHWTGQTLVIFGRSGNFPATIDAGWLDGVNGFRVSKFPGNIPAFLLSGAGDINHDGYDDILIGNWGSSYKVNGEGSYALFGRPTFNSYVDIVAVDGSDGFFIHNEGNNFLTFVGGLGDINGDGIDDCFSENDVIFGSTSPFPASIAMSDLTGTNGFLLKDNVVTAAATGDLNLDGVDDFIVSSSKNYVVYGTTAGFPASIGPSDINGTNGFVIKSVNQSNIGRPVSGDADFNGDGLSDFIVGSDNTGNGIAYVVFGGDHVASLNAGYPQVISITSSGFTLQVNAPETGTIYYAIFSGNHSKVSDHGVIKSDPGAVQTGSFPIGTANTDINELIIGLSSSTTYDVYLFLEDAVGNEGEIYFLDNVTTLAFIDTEAPSITCPGDQELACDATTIPDYTSMATATDNKDANPSITQSPSSGSAFTDGMTITLTAKDNAGNTSNCTFAVNKAADAESPVITCPGDQVLSTGSTTIPDFTSMATVTDNCDGSPTVTQSPLAGSAFTATTTVTLTAEDASGNTQTCTFQVSEAPDTEAPSITCPGDQELACDATTIPDYTSMATATDNKDANPSITQSPAPGSAFTDGMTITMTAEDATGNKANCSFKLVKSANANFTVECPGDQEVEVTSDCQAIVPDITGLVSVNNGCAANVNITQSPVAGTAISHSTDVTITANDDLGNSKSCVVNLILKGDLTPTIDAGNDVAITAGENIQLNINSSSAGTFAWSPAIGLDDANVKNPVASPEVTTTYTVIFTTPEGCFAEDKITVIIEDIRIVQGFSPDNDGVNDTWIIRGIEKYPGNSVAIYNRWGNLVYAQHGYDNSSHVFTGKANRLTSLGAGDLPEGTYFYVIQLDDGEEPIKGFLVLKK